MNDLAYDAGAVTAVIGFTERVSRFLPDSANRYMVLVSCAIGILYALTIRPSAGKADILKNVSSGIMIGLSASGGYAGMKSFTEKRG